MKEYESKASSGKCFGKLNAKGNGCKRRGMIQKSLIRNIIFPLIVLKNNELCNKIHRRASNSYINLAELYLIIDHESEKELKQGCARISTQR